MNNKSKNGDQVKGGRNSTGTTKNIIIPKKDVKLAELIGIILGAIAGYYGGWIESLIMRFVDIMLCIPTFFLILAVIKSNLMSDNRSVIPFIANSAPPIKGI